MTDTSPEYHAYRLLQKIIVGCAALIMCVTLGMFLLATNKSKERCDDLQGIRTYILGATNRAIESLPTIDYYRTHPEEQARALGNLQSQREEFSTPLDCSLF